MDGANGAGEPTDSSNASNGDESACVEDREKQEPLVGMIEVLGGVVDERAEREPDIGREALFDTSKEVLCENEQSLLPQYDRLREAVQGLQDRDDPKRVSIMYTVVGLFAIVFVGAVVGAFVILIAKTFGQLEAWSYQPWGVIVAVGIGGTMALIPIADAFASRWGARDQVAVEREQRLFGEQLQIRVVDEATRRLRIAHWTDPTQDRVIVSTGRGLSARIDGGMRVQTESYRIVRTHLMRRGGAAVGLSGPRGAGKSELLREFCASKEPSIEHGGRIGVLLSAPVAIPPVAFYSVTIRKLCEEVPGYSDPWISATPTSSSVMRRSILWVLAVAAVVGGWYVADPAFLGVPDVEQRTLGQIVLAAGFAAVVVLSIFELRKLRKGRLVSLFPNFLEGSTWGKGGGNAARTKRKDAAPYAREVARDVRYIETRTTGAEASGGAGGVTAKVKQERRWEQLPMSEADLVEEFAKLVHKLEEAGYEIVIGIDELDKLEADADAEDFLNGIKALFAVPGCSFLVSVSESAWAKFAQRGISIRDTFDSSLDAVVILDPPSFSQAMAVLKLRDPELTDPQILFCYCLSGGVPRDLIRAARRLGETNQRIPGDVNTLDTVAHHVLADKAFENIHAALLTARGMGPGPGIAQYEQDLELLRESPMQRQRIAAELFTKDPAFRAQVSASKDAKTPPSPQVAPIIPEREAEILSRIRDQRRQTYTYFHLLAALGQAFDKPGLVSELPKQLEPPDDHIPEPADVRLSGFLALAAARARLEVSPASAWRAIENACGKLDLLHTDDGTSEDGRDRTRAKDAG